MRKLRIEIIDIIPQGPATSNWARLMNANMASIMPQALAAWCEELGHDVRYQCYIGFEDLLSSLSEDVDIAFIASFTRSAYLAYALSALYRRRGAVTVLGGPHARCFPDDSARHFDFVLGLTDKAVLADVLQDMERHRPVGQQLSARSQPSELPSLEQRWKFVAATLKKAPLVKFVPMAASLGCPYTCSFCIDANIPFQPAPLEQLTSDLRFLRTQQKRPRVGWHDPNFGVRFDELMDAIEAAGPPGSIEHVAESSLSLLNEPRLKRMKQLGFRGLLPGIESWFDYGAKSRSRDAGPEKVRKVSEHINLLLRYVPFVQANFVFGLDCDAGPEPFELTKRFLDACPGVFPAYSLFTAFGEAAPLNLDLQRAGRVRSFPFHWLDNNRAMNVQPLNYGWPEFYDHIIDLYSYSFSWRSIGRRLAAQGPGIAGFMNLVRATSSEGWGRIKHHSDIRSRLDEDPSFLPYFEGRSQDLPAYYHDGVKRKLGPFWPLLESEDLSYDHLAYSRKQPAVVAA